MRQAIFCLLLYPGLLFAQENAAVSTQPRLPFTLKTNPLSLINPVQFSVDLLADLPFHAHWSLEMGVGLLLDSRTHAYYAGETYRGLKIKPTIKYYISQSADQDIYIGLALKYHHIRNERYEGVLRQGFQYFEKSLMRREVDTWGAAFRVGAQIYSGKRKRFVFDPSFAFGARHSKVAYPNLPPDAEFTQSFGWFNRSSVPGSFWTFDILLGISMGWAFN